MTVKVSRAQRAAARRLIEIAEAEGQPVDERLEAIANAGSAEQSSTDVASGPTVLRDLLLEEEESPPESVAVYAYRGVPSARVNAMLQEIYKSLPGAAARALEAREQEEQEQAKPRPA